MNDIFEEAAQFRKDNPKLDKALKAFHTASTTATDVIKVSSQNTKNAKLPRTLKGNQAAIIKICNDLEVKATTHNVEMELKKFTYDAPLNIDGK